MGCNQNCLPENLVNHICRYMGETVTIFTNSGGQSGCGFTGVVIGVNNCFVRLTTRIGPAPGCALGNACGGPRRCGNFNYFGNGYQLGSIADIPIENIAAFVHNTV